MKSIDRLKKFAEGGQIQKFQEGGIPTFDEFQQQREARRENLKAGAFEASAKLSGVNMNSASIGNGPGQISEKAAVGMGLAAQGITQGVEILDNALMGDKNFGAQSAAIDGAVHGVSSALMKSGNPYAMAAGAALEGANFLTKAGGQTVQGFDVDINNSGYGNLGHMESSSSRDFGAMIGLGGLNGKKMQAKLARRNQQAQMALDAAAISEDSKFEQEARANNIQNVIMQNQQALAGGIDTSLLGS